ncbi:MAG TPA: hypothetical protein PKA27_04570 [Fimbriimonadaceae bacterium]|nr:hypothetical protein [Fimbriimonadaceae bacterium]
MAFDRSKLVSGLADAIRIAEARPFVHYMKSDEDAVSTLLQIAIHDAYHVGQLVAVKRAVTAMKR